MPRSKSLLAEEALATPEPNGPRLIYAADPECGQHVEILAQDLLSLANQQGFSQANVQLIEKALRFSIEAHAGDSRKSGEPYIQHPIEVASILTRLRLDAETVAGALLHDVVEDSGVTVQLIDCLLYTSPSP